MDGPYSDASPTFTQMSLFPTVEEQIEQIAQSQAEASAPAFSVGMVPEQAVERILSAGTNEPAGALRIYAQYQAGAPAGEMAVSLRKEFGTGGRGYAKTQEAITPNCLFNLGGNQIGARTLDLNQDFRQITAQLDGIAQQFFGKHPL